MTKGKFRFKCLAKVGIRSAAAVDAAKPEGEPLVKKHEVVEVSEKHAVGDQTFLKLADGRGWVFLMGISGKKSGKPLFEAAAAAATAAVEEETKEAAASASAAATEE